MISPPAPALVFFLTLSPVWVYILLGLFHRERCNRALAGVSYSEERKSRRYGMKCERCRKNEASIHLTEIIKNVKSELHLCEDCARAIGVNSKFSSFSLSVPDMLSFLDLDEIGEIADANICRRCGLTFVDYKRVGKLGCPHCYHYLSAGLESIMKSYHGESRHIGKVPFNYVEMRETDGFFIEGKNQPVSGGKNINELRQMLEQAVADERYEDAAVLRDRIRELEVALRNN